MSDSNATSVLKRIVNFIMPIEGKEMKKFLPMALMMMFVLFNYNVLRSLKDALIVPSIGAEAISFIKAWVVTPSAILAMLVYTKMTSSMKGTSIFYSFCLFFLMFFGAFALVLYPYADAIHPDAASLEAFSSSKIDMFLFTIDVSHFKYFVKLYSKWTYVMFYVLSELWGSIMLSLLFWQFANQITRTTEAKRFYPMFGFVGNIGLIVCGYLLQALAQTEFLIDGALFFVGVSILSILYLYYYINNTVLTDPRYAPEPATGSVKKKKPSLSMSEGLKVIFSSKYLGLIAILVLCYGISINLVEGPWKAKVRELYPTQNEYAHFMGQLSKYSGIATMVAMLIGANILKKISWFKGAILTPVMISITGAAFFVFVVFNQEICQYLGTHFIVEPLVLAVTFGLLQNVFSKATKYSFFDPTKEMAYIPIDDELKTKGKAAVDIVGARVAKSSGGLIQSMLFILVPSLTFATMTPYLMVIFLVIAVIWLVDVKLLSKEYEKYFVKKN